jgi:hypothetical protein
MSATDGSQRQLSAASEEELVTIARQVAESMGIRQTAGAHTRISGCQGCGQCLSKPAAASASAQPSSLPAARSGEITEAELVQLVQQAILEVVQELKAREVPRRPFSG